MPVLFKEYKWKYIGFVSDNIFLNVFCKGERKCKLCLQDVWILSSSDKCCIHFLSCVFSCVWLWTSEWMHGWMNEWMIKWTNYIKHRNGRLLFSIIILKKAENSFKFKLKMMISKKTLKHWLVVLILFHILSILSEYVFDLFEMNKWKNAHFSSIICNFYKKSIIWNIKVSKKGQKKADLYYFKILQE